MCGIAGVLAPDGRTVGRDALERMCSALEHRGPDNAGTFSSGSIGLAHTRLSIIDVSDAANQPFVDDDHALVFNGEIYNYRDLRAVLEREGVAVRGASDTAVLFAALCRWGVDVTLERLRGMFAFAFADLRTQTVYLCRDRLGIKPLVWTQRGGNVYWASEVKAIRAVTPVQLDPLKTLASLTGSFESLPRQTCFEDVHQVDAGSYLVCAPGAAPVERRYFDLADLVDEARYRELDAMSTSRAAEELGSVFTRSVEAMLMSDVPMGAFVSGGVDSSLIAATASRLGADIALFTADVEGAHSEVEKARLVAHHVGLPLFEASFAPGDFLEEWAAQTYYYETPIITFTNALPFARVASRARKEGVKPVLTGEGADELFMGYPEFARERYLKVLAAPVRGSEWLYRRASPALAAKIFDPRGGGISRLLIDAAQDFEPQRTTYREHDVFPFLSAKDADRQVKSVQMVRRHLRGLLHRNDRMGMQASIESRFPFLDDDVVAFGLNLPWKHKIKTVARLQDSKHPFVMDKAVVRLHAEKLLPRQTSYASKRGFPMYGHKNLRFARGLFDDGYVAGVAGLSSEGLSELITSTDPYTIAKLASVEVFGRLFDRDEPEADVRELLHANASLIL